VRNTHGPGFLNLEDQTIGKLTVREFLGRNKHGHNTWLCECECGEFVSHSTSNLRWGNIRSCGCWRRQKSKTSENLFPTLHGHSCSKGGNPSLTYSSWAAMLHRAGNPDRKHPLYTAVKVGDRWKLFERFLKDMGERPEGTTLSRFGDVGNYEPGNCAWHTWKEQRVEQRKKQLAALAQAA
jgi:hypothetical protein